MSKKEKILTALILLNYVVYFTSLKLSIYIELNYTSEFLFDEFLFGAYVYVILSSLLYGLYAWKQKYKGLATISLTLFILITSAYIVPRYYM